MKITQNDPRLTAYALGELSDAESAVVKEAIESDSSFAAELGTIQDLAGLLSSSLASGEALSLGDERREEIFQSGKRPDTEVILIENRRRSRFQSFAAIAGVAAVVCVGFFFLSKLNVDAPAGVSGLVENDLSDQKPASRASASSGAPDVKVGEGSSSVSPEVVAQENWKAAYPLSDELITVTQRTSARMPVVGKVDLPIFQRNLEVGIQSTLRIEEFVNSPQYRSKSQVELEGVSVSAELGACPWASEKRLVMIVLRDLKADGISPQIDARLLLDAPNITSIKLVASSTVRGNQPEFHTLPDGQSNALLYEVEIEPREDRFAAVDLMVNDRSAYLPIMGGVPSESTSEFRIAVVLARFAKWHADSTSENLFELEQAARILLTEVTEEQARYALDLILISVEKMKVEKAKR